MVLYLINILMGMDDHIHSVHKTPLAAVSKANAILEDPSCLDHDLYDVKDCFSELVGVEVLSMDLGSSDRKKIFGELF